MIKHASITNKGNRAYNEDTIGMFSNRKVSGFIVCDGLGGHGMGDVASSLAVDLFRNDLESCRAINKEIIEKFFAKAHNKLLTEQKRLNASNKMKTTAAMLLLDKAYAYIGHIGDSRVYAFNKISVIHQTRDHSVPEALRHAGMISESEIRKHPDRNKLLKVLGGPGEKVEGSVSDGIRLSDTRAFLLCSDGFWEYINEEKMCHLLTVSASPDDWLHWMTEEVVRNGKDYNMDNFSAIAVWNM